MKHLFSILALTFFFSLSLFSQDEIILNSGENIKGFVTEISKREVKYKRVSNPDGPVIMIKKREVNKIVYKNGEVEVFALSKPVVAYNQNIFAYNIWDVVYNQFAFSYEHISKNGKISFYIPLSIGYGDSDGPKNYTDLGFTGFGIRLFPTGQHRVTYFLGPEIQFGIGEDYVNDYDPYSGYYNYSKTKQFYYGRFHINNGISYSPVLNLKLSALFGLGIRYYDLKDSYDSGMQSSAYFTISMGYTF